MILYIHLILFMLLLEGVAHPVHPVPVLQYGAEYILAHKPYYIFGFA